jgi:hypothetical protein
MSEERSKGEFWTFFGIVVGAVVLGFGFAALFIGLFFSHARLDGYRIPSIVQIKQTTTVILSDSCTNLLGYICPLESEGCDGKVSRKISADCQCFGNWQLTTERLVHLDIGPPSKHTEPVSNSVTCKMRCQT